MTLDRGHADSSTVLGEAGIHDIARKNYTDEVRRRAVDLYESPPGATREGIAAHLGVSRGLR